MRGVIIGVIIVCVLLIGGAFFFASNGNNQLSSRTIPLNQAYEQRVSDGYWKEGSATPKVTLTEYLDFQGVASLRAFSVLSETLPQVLSFTQYQVHIFTDSSVKNPLPTIAAKNAEAAGRQGKFWEMQQLLFVHQNLWVTLSADDAQKEFDTYAQSLALNMNQFHADIADTTLSDELDKDERAGNQVPVNGIPTFLINGQVVTNFPSTSADLVQLLRTAAQIP